MSRRAVQALHERMATSSLRSLSRASQSSRAYHRAPLTSAASSSAMSVPTLTATTVGHSELSADDYSSHRSRVSSQSALSALANVLIVVVPAYFLYQTVTSPLPSKTYEQLSRHSFYGSDDIPLQRLIDFFFPPPPPPLPTRVRLQKELQETDKKS